MGFGSAGLVGNYYLGLCAYHLKPYFCSAQLTHTFGRLEWPSGGRIACAVAAGLLIALYIIKVMHTMIQRNSLINTYNARARSIRMPESTESVLSRTRTDKLQKDIEELTERAQGFSKQAPGLNPSKSMTRSASSKSPYYNPGSQVSYNAGSMAPASSVPFGVAHQPYYGDSYGPPPGAWPGGRYY